MTTPSTRRRTLATLCLGVAAAFTSRGEAIPQRSLEIEATPHGGRTSGYLPPGGGCAFAPMAGTRFGGLGGRVRLRQPLSTTTPTSVVVIAQGAVESQANTLIAPGSEGERNVPPDQFMGAGSVAVGLDTRLFGVHLGVGAREVYGLPVPTIDPACVAPACRTSPTYPHNRLQVFPEARLRVGFLDGFYGDASVGAYTPHMTLRPGLQAGLGYATRAGHSVALHYGVQLVHSDSAGQRVDLSGTLPVTERVSVGVGVAAVNNDARVDFDGRASVTVRFGQ